MDIVNGGGKWQCCHFLNDERTIGCQFDLKCFFSRSRSMIRSLSSRLQCVCDFIWKMNVNPVPLALDASHT